MRMRKLFLYAIVPVFFTTASGQVVPDFRSPVNIPIYLSGSFGELRTDHFHSGIDIKTQGVTGQQVFAIDSGFVSRIKIQAGGYGNALYISHPNGYTSVYAHLEKFGPHIQEYVRSKQYRLESHEIDLSPGPAELHVKKGELVAYSGNSGSSSGPHLHFEVRRTSDQHPLNALKYNFPVKDGRPPEFRHLVIYPAGSNSAVRNSRDPYLLVPVRENGGYTVRNGGAIPVNGSIGFGVEIYDYLDGAANRCGIYSIELFVDDEPYYSSDMSEFSFSESRFINAHIDYSLKKEKKISVQKLFRAPYNELSIYRYLNNEGRYEVRDTLSHEIRILATDSYGNSSKLVFEIRGVPAPQHLTGEPRYEGIVLPYNAQSGFTDRNIRIEFPARCFYDDVRFSFARTNGSKGMLSDLFHVHTDRTPVHRPYRLSLRPNSVPEGRSGKLCIVSLGDDNEMSYEGGSYADGYVTAEVRKFGRFAIAIDTLAPTIIPLNIHKGKDLGGQPGIRFAIRDDLSGIVSYKGRIDQQWVLFEYDPKNELLSYEFDSRVPISKKNHDLEVQISDATGNTSEYRIVFYR